MRRAGLYTVWTKAIREDMGLALAGHGPCLTFSFHLARPRYLRQGTGLYRYEVPVASEGLKLPR